MRFATTQHDDEPADFPRRRHACLYGDGGMRVRERGEEPCRAIGMDEERRRRPALAALFQPQGGAPPYRLCTAALFVDRQRGHQVSAQPADPGRHLRSAGPRLLLHRPPALALAAAAALFVLVRCSPQGRQSFFWLLVLVGGIGGYLAPTAICIDRRISKRQSSIAPAFRISWTCWWSARIAGLPMEAAFDRVGRELGDSYPSLTANIHMTNLEIRAGKNLKDALERSPTGWRWRRRAPSPP